VPPSTPSPSPASFDGTAWCDKRTDGGSAPLAPVTRARRISAPSVVSVSDRSGTIGVADAAKWEDASIDVVIQTASIFTDDERRDADLRSSNFFAADSFPAISFKSSRIERQGDAAKIHGDLTIRGEGAGMTLGDDVKIDLTIEASRRRPG
jgi:polyisoprenoid-binding protein YceI